MNEQPNLTDSLVRGLILSIFLVMATYLVYAWISMSNETAGWVHERAAAKAELLKKRDAQIAALGVYTVVYDSTGNVDTSKAVTMPIDIAEKMMLKEATAGETASHPRSAVAEANARASFPMGAALYARDCGACHGASADGGIIAKSMSEPLRAYLKTQPLSRDRIGSLQILAAYLAGGAHTPVLSGYSGSQWSQLHGYLNALVAEQR